MTLDKTIAIATLILSQLTNFSLNTVIKKAISNQQSATQPLSSKRERRGMLPLRALSCIIVALDLNDRSKS
ncbi:MAG: hypothetical protein QNJ74_22740 [Trichodesmium sp. MO_231.B1]|nr:hypothetical protein [Trichodesmium sp. MO_231.B1]